MHFKNKIIYLHKKCHYIFPKDTDITPIIFLCLIYSLFFYIPIGSNIFWWLQKEDGPLETLSAVFLFISAIITFKKYLNDTTSKYALKYLWLIQHWFPLIEQQQGH